MTTTTIKLFRFGLSTALAAGLLAGCSMAGGGAHPSRFADGAGAALTKGDAEKAVNLAEQAVASDPRNASYRVLLGNAYLRSGRFASAQQAYNEAMDLGEDSGKAALSLALADAAIGRNAEALDTLASYRDTIPAADFGLALALAGDTNRGVAVLTDALRGGDNSAKVRQNLAFAYALDGRWREARIMAAQDVPADKLDARMSDWALMGKPEDVQKRVASLLGVPLVAGDAGQPAALALANFPAAAGEAQVALTAAQSAEAPQLAQAAAQELPPVDPPAASPSMDNLPPVQLTAYEAPPSAAAQVPQAPSAPAKRDSAYRVVGDYIPDAAAAAPAAPAPQAPPFAPRATKPVQRQTAAVAAPAARSTHVVQLGSFSTPEGARRAWRHYSARMPQLAGYRNVTTQVTVNGRQFWRVQAAGFAGYGQASSMCGSVKARGGACLVMAAPGGVTPQGRPVDSRMARRR